MRLATPRRCLIALTAASLLPLTVSGPAAGVEPAPAPPTRTSATAAAAAVVPAVARAAKLRALQDRAVRQVRHGVGGPYGSDPALSLAADPRTQDWGGWWRAAGARSTAARCLATTARALAAIGSALVVIAGLVNNLLPMAQAGVKARTVLWAGMIVAMVFCIVLLIAIAAAHFYGVAFLAPPNPDTSAGKVQLATPPFWRQPLVWGITAAAVVFAVMLSFFKSKAD